MKKREAPDLYDALGIKRPRNRTPKRKRPNEHDHDERHRGEVQGRARCAPGAQARAEALQDEIHACAEAQAARHPQSPPRRSPRPTRRCSTRCRTRRTCSSARRAPCFTACRWATRRAPARSTIDDDAQVVKLIRKHLPDKFEQLVKVKETPIKAAIKEAPAPSCKKIGVKVQDTGDVVFLKDAVDEVDKLVKALLKGAEAELEDEEAEA
jgi:hypothetical protein